VTAPSTTARECPECGHVGLEKLCPHDGMSTLLQGAVRSDADRVKPGTVVAERYQVTGILGKGGFGAVFKARHAGTGQDVALKVLSGGEADDQVALKRFFHEARVTAGLKHPNTIKVFDFGQDDDGIVYLAMELLVGEPLAAQLRSRIGRGVAYSEREACEIGIAVLRSLGEAHAAGLVHRDLKPDNIFLHRVGDDDQPIPKVLDFGIAKMHGMSLTGGDQVLGTPAYMSPEQVRGQRLDARSDLYSLGIVLFQLVAGTLPFKGETPVSTIYMHLEAEVPDLRQLARQRPSEAFIAVVNRALSKRPDERFQSAKDMREALQSVLQHAPDTSEPTMAQDAMWSATQVAPSAPHRPVTGPSRPLPTPTGPSGVARPPATGASRPMPSGASRPMPRPMTQVNARATTGAHPPHATGPQLVVGDPGEGSEFGTIAQSSPLARLPERVPVHDAEPMSEPLPAVRRGPSAGLVIALAVAGGLLVVGAGGVVAWFVLGKAKEAPPPVAAVPAPGVAPVAAVVPLPPPVLPDLPVPAANAPVAAPAGTVAAPPPSPAAESPAPAAAAPAPSARKSKSSATAVAPAEREKAAYDERLTDPLPKPAAPPPPPKPADRPAWAAPPAPEPPPAPPPPRPVAVKPPEPPVRITPMPTKPAPPPAETVEEAPKKKKSKRPAWADEGVDDDEDSDKPAWAR
jgi:serine/threonine-protein kinase